MLVLLALQSVLCTRVFYVPELASHGAFVMATAVAMGIHRK
jgi:hypothetical protein